MTDSPARKLYTYQETVDLLNELCRAATSSHSLTDARKDEIWKAVHWALVDAIGGDHYAPTPEASDAS